ncbi:MAG: hypothetical protein AAF456_22330 [Planctomycetota bacterium]
MKFNSNSTRLVLMVVLLITCSPATDSLARDDETTKVDLLVESLEGKTRARLLYLTHAIKLTALERFTISRHLSRTIAELAESVVARDESASYMRGELPEELEEAIEDCIEIEFGVERLNDVRADSDLREQFLGRTLITTVLARLDLGLALSRTQIEQVHEILENEWDNSGFRYASPAYASCLPFDGLPIESIDEVLTARQRAYWRLYATEPLAQARLWFASDDESRIEEFRPQLNHAFENRIGVLQDHYGLDQNQLEKLRVLTVRYREELLEVRQTAYSDVQFTRDHGRPPTDAPQYGRAMMAPASLLGSEGQWSGYVARVLQDEAREDYLQLSQARKQLHHSAASYHMARTFQRWGNMDGAQTMELYDLCLEHISPDTNWTRGDRGMYFAVFELPELQEGGLVNAQQMRALNFRIQNMHKLHELLDDFRSEDE